MKLVNSKGEFKMKKQVFKMQKGFFTVLTMLLVSTSMLFANGASEEQKADEPVTIEFIQWWAAENGGDYLNKAIAGFEAENPNIKVKLVTMPFGDSRKQVIAAHATGETSDIIGMNPPWTREFVDMDILEPLDSYMENDANFNKADYYQAAMEPIKGHTYLAPYNTMSFYLFYNKDMFKAAGLEAPTTWAEMREDAKKLTNPEKNQYGFTMVLSETDASNGSILTLYPLLYALNGRTFVDGKFKADTPEMRKTLDFVQALNEDGSILPGSTSKSEMASYEEFANGNIGMMIAHNGQIMTFKKRNPDFNFGVIKIPTYDGTGSADMRDHGWDMGMSKDSKHKAEAWKFIAYLLRKDNMIESANTLMKVPSMYDAPVNYIDDMPLVKSAIDDMSNSTMVEELMMMPKSGACWTALTKASAQVLQGKMTSEEAVTYTQNQWDTILEQ
jgi:multiple sugar transport system substrate-binding protein